MPTAAVNGQSIHYQDTGGTGPAVIFSHGLFMDHEMFAPQVRALQGRYRCITWDERGHGQTAGERLAPFSYYDSANDLAALLRHLRIEQAVLAGMSQGGFLSLRCALAHPDLVRALVLIDTQAGKEDPERIEGHLQLTEDWAANGLSDTTADIVESIILGDAWAGASAWREKWKRFGAANVRGCMQTLASRDDITAKLGQIKVPALVIHGDADAAIELSLAERLTAEIPDARLVVIPGAGHAANLTHPDAVNPAIQAFLADLEARDAVS
jgi:pimeloyl-ACP methyl ester carboxylesterase